MNCECNNWERCEPVDLSYLHDDLHHSRCPKFATEKRPRLFYFEEAEDCWAPWPTSADNYAMTYLDCLDDGDDMEISFRRKDMTDKEFTEIPDEDEWYSRFRATDRQGHDHNGG